MKRLVICLDGTWNNAAKEKERNDGSRVYRPTNVLKLARATHATDANGIAQITYYDAGVGAMNRAPNFRTRIIRFADNKLGGGWGAGFEVNIEEAYTFIANNYEPDDQLFVFGFSRGAAQARSLCNFIEWCGGIPSKNDVYYVPKLFGQYLKARGAGSGQSLIAKVNTQRVDAGKKPIDPFRIATIEFLGVWDTVLALGSRILARGGSTRRINRYHTPPTPPAIANRVRHALAIDERRHDFQPELWNGQEPTLKFEQRWFPGVHSNVGGGLIDDSLANSALRWICDEAIAAGLSMNAEYLRYLADRPQYDRQLTAEILELVKSRRGNG
ncbi:MAG: DUF2235 domain-containing protein [Acidobacteriota bacterium]|nr:DUF2235 domain-containing protein [Acidobacteriota bacterium]MDH3783998.1 DUF2235 domain-containing protein [Acidobacteriota bacterium]